MYILKGITSKEERARAANLVQRPCLSPRHLAGCPVGLTQFLAACCRVSVLQQTAPTLKLLSCAEATRLATGSSAKQLLLLRSYAPGGNQKRLLLKDPVATASQLACSPGKAFHAKARFTCVHVHKPGIHHASPNAWKSVEH